LSALSAPARAQLPQPKLDWIYPPGGQRGTQVEITVGGTDLDDGRALVFSHPNITARAKRTAPDEFYPEGQPTANQFTLEIGSDVPPGLYDAQVVGRHGASTPRLVQVTGLTEVLDNGANHAIDQAQLIASGTVVSGRADAEQLDYYSVELNEGDQLSCEAWAQRIDSQAEMWVEVCDASGAPLAAERSLRRRDPALRFKAPAAGKYLIRAHDATFRGGEPFYYRIALHTGPTIDSVGQEASHLTAAQPREIDAIGMTAPAVDADVTEPPDDIHSQAQRMTVPGEMAGRFFPDGDTDWFELTPDAAGEAVLEVFSQRLGLATDPLLTVFRVTKNDQGVESLEQVAEADNGDARPATPGYNTASDDPYVRMNLEKDTVYRVMVRDQNSSSRADPGNRYRLVVRRPAPDYRLLVAPASPWAADAKVPLRWPLTLRTGGTLAIPVVAIRYDGFVGDVALSAQGLPAGVTCSPVKVRAGKNDALVVLSAEAQVAPWVGSIHIIGDARIADAEVQREAASASLVSDTTVATFDRARLNHQLVIAVNQEAAPVSVRCDNAVLETTPTGVAKANLALEARAELKDALALTPVGLPEGVTAKVTVAEDKKSAELELTVGEKVAEGEYDFVVTGKPKVLYQNNPEAAARASEDQSRIAKVLEGIKSQREQSVAAAGTGADATSPEIKQLDERIAKGDAALKEATDRATKLAAAAQPAERLCYVVSNVATLRVVEKAKE
jgi:hypothetical protein